MKTGNHYRGLAGLRRSLAIAAAALTLGAAASKAALVFDNISNYENSVTGAAVTSTSSTPNTFMGDGYVVSPGTLDITGFDIFPVNNTGTNFTGLRISIYVWGTVNTGTVSATAPAFSNLLNTYTLTSAGTYTTGFFYSFESTSPGVTPGVQLGAPLLLSTGTTIGITLAYQGTTDGVNYASINNLSSVITYGTAPTVGSQVFNGYYRNANSEVNGNFTSAPRSLTGLTNQSLALRIYGDVVPEPGTWAMIALGGVALLLVCRQRTASVA